MAITMESDLKNALYDEKFDAGQYLAAVVTSGDIKSQLEENWQAVEQVKHAAIQGLRENAFRYHTIIVNSTKEIDSLEQGLVQLRTALTAEQKTLEKAMETPATAAAVKVERRSTMKRKSRSSRKSVFEYLNKIEGFSHAILKERERYFLAKKNLNEYDPVTFQRRHELIALLFSDCLILTLWMPHYGKNVHTEYKFVELIYLDQAEVSVFKPYNDKTFLNIHLSLHFITSSLSGSNTGLAALRFPFKLSTPDSDAGSFKLFDCDSEEERTEWIDNIRRLNGLLGPQAGAVGTVKRTSEFRESMDNILSRYRSTILGDDGNGSVVPLWFREAATDIRDDFEMAEYADAVELAMRAKNYWSKVTEPTARKENLETYHGIQVAEEKLVVGLQEELRCAMDCPFGFDRTLVGELITLLATMGRRYNAGVVYLDHRTRLLRLAIESVRPDDTLTDYVRRCTDIFFEQVYQSVDEFAGFGLNSHDCISALTGWTRFQMNTFVDRMKRFIFSEHTNLGSAGSALTHIRNLTALSTAMGMDLVPLLNVNLEAGCVDYIDIQTERLIDYLKTDHRKRQFKLLTFRSREEVLIYAKQHSEEGRGSLQPYFEGVVLNIPVELIDFGGIFQQYVKDVCMICSDSMRQVVEQLLSRVASVPVQLLREAIISHSHADQFTQASLFAALQFLSTNIFEIAESTFNEKFGSCDYLLFIEKEALAELTRVIIQQMKTTPQ